MKDSRGEFVRIRNDRKEIDHDPDTFSKIDAKRKNRETPDKRFSKRPRERSREREREKRKEKEPLAIRDKDRIRDRGRDKVREREKLNEEGFKLASREGRVSSREKRAPFPIARKSITNSIPIEKKENKLLSELSELALKKSNILNSNRELNQEGTSQLKTPSQKKNQLPDDIRSTVLSNGLNDKSKVSPTVDTSTAKKKKDRWASDDEEECNDPEEVASEEGEIFVPNAYLQSQKRLSPSPPPLPAIVVHDLKDVAVGSNNPMTSTALPQQQVTEKYTEAIDELKTAFTKEPVSIQTSEVVQPSQSIEVHQPTKPKSTYNPLLYGCRSVENFERIKYLAEGAYGYVFMAKDKKTGEIVAIKQVKMTSETQKEGFPITALRETNILLSLCHPNIVRVHEMVTGSSLDKIYMVMEYFDADLKSVLSDLKKRGEKLETAEVKCLMQQLLSAVAHLHKNWYIHRDLKTSNMLYSSSGKLAICDFGLARKYEDPIRPYTPLVVTLWYRPPELLLGARQYSTQVDMWSVGCIFGEFLLGEPLFPGQGEVDQLSKIFSLLGAPTEERWPGFTKLPGTKTLKWKSGSRDRLAEKFPAASFSGGPCLSSTGMNLMSELLTLDPKSRISAADALRHQWFTEAPLPKSNHEMPQPPKK